MGQEVSAHGGPEAGYHVLRVNPGSPGARAGLRPYFDFVVAVGSRRLEAEDSTLVDALQAGEGQTVQLEVYSLRTGRLRTVPLVPSAGWGGIGLLGVSIRFCAVRAAEEHVWHVTAVAPGGPAHKGDVRPDDYIVGTPDVLFTEEDDLYMLFKTSLGQPVSLYVYTPSLDEVRVVSVVPSDSWGGEGILGCELGYGLLHRIPRDKPKPSTMEDLAAATSPAKQVPAQQQQAAPQINLSAQSPSPAPVLVQQQPVPAPQINLSTQSLPTPAVQQPATAAPEIDLKPTPPSSPAPTVQQPTTPQHRAPEVNLSSPPASAPVVQDPVSPQQRAPEIDLQPASRAPQTPASQIEASAASVVPNTPPPAARAPGAPRGDRVVMAESPAPASPNVSNGADGDGSLANEDSLMDGWNDANPFDASAPSTPAKTEAAPAPAPATPPSASGKSLDDHKKKLADLQQKLDRMRNKDK